MNRRQSIFVVSDATGNTAERVVRSALLQFGADTADLQMWPRTRTFEDVDRLVAAAERLDAMVVHTLVNAELRAHLSQEAGRRDVDAVDLIGALLGKLSDHLGQRPIERPGTRVALDAAYFRRIDALEFAVKTDDGQSPRLLSRADLVLVGVSRTSKTPVATFLAGQGLRVANVPIVRGVALPAELRMLPAARVVALSIDPLALLRIRQARVAQLGIASEGGYTDRDEVFSEVRWALELYRSLDWPVVEVTHLAVEETAAEVLKAHTHARLSSSVDADTL